MYIALLVTLILCIALFSLLLKDVSQPTVSSGQTPANSRHGLLGSRPESEAIPMIDQWARQPRRKDLIELNRKLRKEGFDFTRARLIELYDERLSITWVERETRVKRDTSALKSARSEIAALARTLTTKSNGSLIPLSREHIGSLQACLHKDGIEVSKSALRAEVERQSIMILAKRLVKARLNPPTTVSISPDDIGTFIEVCKQAGYLMHPSEQQEIICIQQISFLAAWVADKAGTRPKTPQACVSTYISLFGENYEHVAWYKNCFRRELESVDFRAELEAEVARIIRAEKKNKVLSYMVSPAAAQETTATPSIDEMSGEEFEIFLEELFKRMGHKVHRTPLSNDQGADLIVEKLGIKTAIQAKRYTGPVSNSAVQEIVAAKTHYNCDQAIVVTNSTFTRSAKALATSNKVQLWDNDHLTLMKATYF